METGATVYLGDGRLVEFIAKVDDVFVVREIYEFGDGEEPRGEVFTARAVHLQPPVAKLDERITALKKEVAELQNRKRAIEAEITASQVDEKDRKARITRHEAMARIDDFLSGRFTHFVFFRYGAVRVLSFDEAMKRKMDTYEKVPTGVRLLTLFGETNGDLSWRIHQYSDGSGSFDAVVPCCSLDEAIADATRRINGQIEEWRKDKEKTHWLIDTVARSAAAIGMELPDDCTAAMKAYKAAKIVKARETKEQELREIDRQLAEIGELDATCQGVGA